MKVTAFERCYQKVTEGDFRVLTSCYLLVSVGQNTGKGNRGLEKVTEGDICVLVPIYWAGHDRGQKGTVDFKK